MKLTDAQITEALDRAVDASLHIEDKGKRGTAIRRQAVQEGFALALKMQLPTLQAALDAFRRIDPDLKFENWEDGQGRPIASKLSGAAKKLNQAIKQVEKLEKSAVPVDGPDDADEELNAGFAVALANPKS